MPNEEDTKKVEENIIPYQEEYRKFLDTYRSGTTTGEAVGICIARMAQRFVEANIVYGKALISFNTVASFIEKGIDDNTGKAISSAKAKVMADATSENKALVEAKIDLNNIEQILNALKALQRGIMAEFNYSGNM